MKRKLVAMMLCVLVVSIFGGCGLFTSSDSDEGTGGDQTQQQAHPVHRRQPADTHLPAGGQRGDDGAAVHRRIKRLP